jgi:hypothetical protein
MEVTTEQTVTFMDTHDVSNVEVESGSLLGGPPVPHQVEIGRFLERPVLINTYTWASTSPADAILVDINPWELFINNPGVSSKLDYYQLLRGCLKIRFLINGSAFQYGLVYGAYEPLADYREMAELDYTRASQQPHVELTPSSSEVETLCCPFVSQNNWIDLSPTGALGNMTNHRGLGLGRLRLIVVSPLRSFSTVNDAITISTMAWMEDVVLDLPTPYANLQGGVDEYRGSGVISAPASAIASVAGRLKDFPVIGRLATATQIGATAVSSIASLFGFSAPNQIADTERFKNEPFARMAASAGADTASKLSLDPKQEISVDPRLIGMPTGEDSMDIMHIAKRNSTLTSVIWAPASAVGTELVSIPVSPGLVTYGGGTADFTKWRTTALFWLSRGFTYWSGSITITIKVIATKLHRGRLRIVYFPRESTAASGTDYSNVAHNVILDINEDQEAEIEIPWCQLVPYLSTARVNVGSPSVLGLANGVLNVYVLNELSANSATGVSVLLSIRAGDDFKLARPYANRIQNYLTASPDWQTSMGGFFQVPIQGPDVAPTNENWSGLVPAPTLQGATSFSSPGSTDYFPLSSFGEVVTSLRQVVKRDCPYLTYIMTTTEDYVDATLVLPAVPYDLADGDWTALNSNLGSLSESKNYATYVTYFRQGFVAVRGGTRYRMAVDARSSKGTLTASGALANYGMASAVLTDAVAITRDVDAFPHSAWEGANGSQVFATATNAGVEVEVPYFFPFNFVLGCARNFMALGLPAQYVSSANSVKISVPVPVQDDGTGSFDTFSRIGVFTSAADDFSLDWFIGAPTLFEMTVPGRSSIPPP